MIRFVQVATVIVILLVARSIIYAWLKQPDTLPVLLRRGLDAMLVYFAWVTVGFLVLSFLSGKGFGPASGPAAAFMTLGMAIYTGAGVAIMIYILRGQALARGRSGNVDKTKAVTEPPRNQDAKKR